MDDDAITAAIRKLTARTIACRFWLEGERRAKMALELKGLKGKALKARANLDALNAAYDKFNEAAPAHMADVAGLAEQIGGMQEDLEFAAQTMGNSVNGSATGATETPRQAPPVILDVDGAPPPRTESTASPAPPVAQRQFDRMG